LKKEIPRNLLRFVGGTREGADAATADKNMGSVGPQEKKKGKGGSRRNLRKRFSKDYGQQ